MFVPAGVTPGEVVEPAEAASHPRDGAGGRCPVDGTIMTRTQVDRNDASPFHLERCSSCRGVWFDAGEWKALAEIHLLERLDELWSQEFRTHQRREGIQREAEQRLERTFGPELYAELRTVAGRLRGHERRSQALAFLREASEE
jgi:Zn-finger nucleic acid-binding protein